MVTDVGLTMFWNCIKELNYVVLRNYENVLEDVNNGGDIDILVDDKEEFIKTTGAIALSRNDDLYSYNYSVHVNNTEILVDLRVLGDGYYDREWEKSMLENRTKYKEFYILSQEDYLYSVMYHCILHKKTISAKYDILLRRFGIYGKIKLIKVLNEYMNRKSYRYVIPIDKGVCFNIAMYRLLKVYKIFRIDRIEAFLITIIGRRSNEK